MAHGESSGISVRDFVALLRRHLWLIVAIAVLAAAGAYFYSSSKTPMYAASAQLLYQPAIDPTNPGAAQGYVDPNAQQLRVEAATTVIMGPDIAKRVEAAAGPSSEWPSYGMEATVSSSAPSGSSSSYSTGVTVSVSSPSAEWAAKLANAYASEFISWGADGQRKAYTDAATLVEAQLKDMTTPEERASSEYVILQDRLRTLEVRAATATGDFTLVVPATVPTQPYAPRPKNSAVLAFAVGLIVGLGAAFLREKLDTKVRSYREVSELLGLSVVGRIPTIPKETLAKGPLVTVSDGDGPAANALRRVRTNLDFVSMGAEHRSLMIASALPGEGKSVTIANLAVSLALSGKRVFLVDADLRRPQVHHLLGLRNVAGVSSVIAGKTTLEKALQAFEPRTMLPVVGSVRASSATTVDGGESSPRLWALTAGPTPPNPGEMVASERFAKLLAELSAMSHDYLLIDSPAFLSIGDASAVAASVDGIVLVVNLKLTRRPVLEEFRELLELLPTRKLGVIVVGEKSEDRHQYYSDR